MPNVGYLRQRGRSLLGICVLALTGLSGILCARLGAAQSHEHAIRGYLAVKYDDFVITKHGGRLILGLAYNPTAKLDRLDSRKLDRYLPSTEFYVTELDTPYMEYPKVKVLIAVKGTCGHGTDIRTCLALDFSEPSRKFLKLFEGVVVSTRNDKEEFTFALGMLFSVTLYKGSVRMGQISDRKCVAQIFHDDMRWADVEVVFAPNGAVREVQLPKPQDPE